MGSQREDFTSYSIAWVKDTEWLLTGTSVGLLGWKVKETKVKEITFPRHSPKLVRLDLPPGPERLGLGCYVDSVTSLGKGLVAAKCVGYGKIFVFRTEAINEDKNFYKVEVLAKFNWSKTDNFYMNIGGDINLGLMGCGDDVGSIWLYHLPNFRLLTEKESNSSKLKPLGRLPWP